MAEEIRAVNDNSTDCESGENARMDKMVKNKEASFQYLKIIAMIMIVFHHLIAKNVFNIDTQVIGITANKIILQILGNNAFIGNNLFFLVSAWFLSRKLDKNVNFNYSIKACWKIEKTVLFYSISMCSAMMIIRGGQTKVHCFNLFFQH